MSLTCDVLIDDPRWSERLDAEQIVKAVVGIATDLTGVDLHPEAEVSFIFADDARIRGLNAEWRKKDAATNVLSFPASQSGKLKEAILIGDIILAFETIDREANEESKTFAQHSSHMIAHGFLHLIGYDHETEAEAREMESIESKILLGFGLPDPWASSDEAREA